MALYQIVVLALVQGITEFLPISSSGHLILLPKLTDWPDQGQVIDVAVHVGTLGAVLLYFWRDIWGMATGTVLLLAGRREPGARLAFLVMVGTVPVVAAGVLVKLYLGDTLRSVAVIAWATLGFGIVLFVTDRIGLTLRRLEHLTFADAVIIGLSQVLALIPGTSRSGITMSAARILGMERSDAARFSLLLSVPAIMGAGVVEGMELYQSQDADLTAAALIATLLAFFSALIAIAVMLAWLRRATFTPFVIYRMLLGGALLYLVYGTGTGS